MDATDEKLTTLKKVYVDMILSISKEAAARVMASERKSVRSQHELKVAKEDGVGMLVRLKQTMDSQNSEAEAAFLNQQKKIEELEAQLQEAEDIVRDLREELGELQAELERVKSENSPHVNELVDACSEEVHVENNISSYQSSKYCPHEPSLPLDVTVTYPRQGIECCKCYNKIVCTCGAFTGGRDLPSIILGGKDPKLYKKECTQRICACERNLLDRDLCLSEVTDKVKVDNNGRELKERRHTFGAPASGAKILTELEKKLLADINLVNFQSFPQKRKRAVRRRKTVITLGGKQSCLFPKPDKLPEHSATSNPISVNDNARSAENPSKIGPELSGDKAQSQNQPRCAKASDNERNIVESYDAGTMHEDGGAREKVMPLRVLSEFSESLVSEFSESLCYPNSKMDVEKVDVPSPSLESNSCDLTKGLSSLPVKERVIKYTFQRKRKRQALSGSEVNGSYEMDKRTGDGQNNDQKLEQPKPSLLKESSQNRGRCRSEVNGFCETEMKTGDKQNGDQKLELPKPSLSKESSRDRRRLAQVAQQLISLSEKKCWH